MRGVILAILGVLATATSARGGVLQVVVHHPTANAIAPATTVVRIDFDRPLDPATVSRDTIRVFGRGTGTASGPLTLSEDGRSVTLVPARAFSAGEVVLVNLSHALAAADGTPLRAAGWAFPLTIATTPTARSFTRIDTLANRSSPTVATRIYGSRPPPAKP